MANFQASNGDKGLWILSYVLGIPVFTTLIISLGGGYRNEYRNDSQWPPSKISVWTLGLLSFLDDIIHW